MLASGIAATSRTATPAITELQGRAWSSWHLYGVGPDDYLRVVSTIVPPVVKQLSALSLVDRFFFIRYVDEGGHHVRLRLRFREGCSSDAVDRVTSALQDMATEASLTVLPRALELEVERYGGLQFLPLSLDLFCLSSLAALDWLARHADQPKSQQLPALMGLLTNQAAALARGINELAMLLDYFAGWRTRMAAPMQHGDRTFESHSEQIISFLRLQIEASLADAAPQRMFTEGARVISAATFGLAPEARSKILQSHMHMTANRLGLRNTEESYVTQILQRALHQLVERDGSYAQELNTRLCGQQTTAQLDALVQHCLEAQWR